MFVWQATPAIQCALRLFDSFNSETTKINYQFLNKSGNDPKYLNDFIHFNFIGRDCKCWSFIRQVQCNANCAFQQNMCFLASVRQNLFYTQKKFGINLALVPVSGVPPICQTQKSSHFVL